MKAFRQINFKQENRLVWSYTGALVLVGLILMIRPVLAQEENNGPQVKVDVKKEYDEDGNLIRMDSVRTWTWSGESFSPEEFDSLWNNGGLDPDAFLPRNFDFYGFNDMPFPPIHNFWHWNGEDSTAYSYLDQFFDDGFLQEFRRNFNFPDQGSDSLNYSHRGLNGTEEFLNEDFQQYFRDLEERMQQYQKDHQMLIDKYLNEHEQDSPDNPDVSPNSYMLPPAGKDPRKYGKI